MKYYSPLIQFNKHYQQDPRFLHTFIPNKSFGKLSRFSSTNFTFLKKFNSDFSYIEVWFRTQNSKGLENYYNKAREYS